MASILDKSNVLTRRGLIGGFVAAAGVAAATALLQKKEIKPEHLIERKAHEAKKAIEHRLKQVPHDQPLYVVVGECHDLPSHKLFLQALIRDLQTAGHKTAIGLEADHRTMPDIFGNYDGYWQEKASSGCLRLNTIEDRLTWREGDQATKNFYKFLVAEAQGTSIRFLDLAMTYGMLDDTDVKTRSLMHKAFPQGYRAPFSGTDPLAIKLRNQVMVDGAREHARESGAGIYLMQCGALHVFGSASKKLAYEDSLSYLLLEGHSSVHALHLYEPNKKDFPHRALEAINDGLGQRVSGLPYGQFDYKGLKDADIPEKQVEEWGYMRHLAKGSSLVIYQDRVIWPFLRAKVVEEEFPQAQIGHNNKAAPLSP